MVRRWRRAQHRSQSSRAGASLHSQAHSQSSDGVSKETMSLESEITGPRPTTLIVSPRLSTALGTDVTIASETFQWTGSFKFRAAYNLARSVPQDEIITASSGNFGQAMAFACKLLGKKCTVVMPANSVSVK